ncbi:MAG TPA: DUF742 domain-containing protein [Kribbellaceae bacterium]|nr:DUF742 domain-containing protein [Kribbellaceae bacterium]
MSTPDTPENAWLDNEAGPVVRPYAMTGGRTRPRSGEFDLISLVVATRPVSTMDLGLGPEHLAIMDLCRHPISVAEVAAHLDLPVGIVRVLLGDLLDKRLILAREPQHVTQLPGEGVFKAVINGLRSL